MKSKLKFPKGIPYIIGNEAAERFSFYGMKTILTTFLVSQFFNPLNNPDLQIISNARANEITHTFNSMAYFLPIVGSVLADWFFGKYKVILYLSLVYCLGHAFLAIFENNLDAFLIGLLLIAIGSGGIKPCVSANVGDQFNESNKSLLSKAYTWFYFSINVGSFVSMLLTPVLLQQFGPSVAFGVPGILMALATLIFFLGKNKYIKNPPSGIKKENFITISFYALWHLKDKKKGTKLLDVAKQKFNVAAVEGTKSVWEIITVFSLIPIFWALNDQNSSEWVLQATKLDLHFMGYTWLAQQIQSVNAILVLIYIPLFNFVIFPLIKKMNFNFTPYRKIGAGFILTIIAFTVIYYIQMQVDNGLSPSMGWQLLAYAILAAAEVLIYQTGLEYAYEKSPTNMKSMIMALWLLTISIGNYLVSLINKSIANNGIFKNLEGANYYLFFIVLMFATSILYAIISKNFDKDEKQQR